MDERQLTIRLNKIERKLDNLLEILTAKSEPTLIPIGTAAKRLGKSVNALRKQVKRGAIGCHYNPDNRRYYFDCDYIEKLREI